MKSVLIDFAGSTYLIGAPKGCLKALGGRRPSNVVLLTWDAEQIEGLSELSEMGSQSDPLRIWTSDWIIETIRHDAKSAGIWKQVSRSSENGALELRPVPPFEERHREQIRPGIGLSLRYEVAKTPRLQAQFEFFSHRLIVRMAETAPAIAEIDIDSYRRICMEALFERFPQARISFGDMFEHRLGELTNEKCTEDLLKRPLDSSCPVTVFGYALSTGRILDFSGKPHPDRSPRDLTPPEIGDNGFIPPSQRFDGVSSWNKTRVIAECPPLQPATAADRELRATKGTKSDPGKARIFAAIACGGLSTHSGGQIHPARRVMLENKGNISLLGLKLIDFFLDQKKPEHMRVFQPVLMLMVSPWTEAVVREEVARFKDLWKPKPAWDVLYLRQTVVPRYQNKDGKLALYHDRGDGHLLYRPSGHFDILRLLLDAELPPFEGETLVYFTNYNNLGRNLTPDILRLAEYLAKPKNENVPIVFELIRQSRMEEGSYWVQGDTERGCKRLIKPVYRGVPSLSDLWANSGGIDEPAELLMSTGSFLMSRDRLSTRRCELEGVPFFVRSEIPVPELNDETEPAEADEWLHFERDIDQVTWLDCLGEPNGRCHGVEFHTEPGKERTRYWPVKQQKDLYGKQFEKVEELYKDVTWRMAPKDRKDPLHPLLLSPVEFNAPWGGGRIRYHKKQQASLLPVSETWEFSNHPRGVSSAYDVDPLHPFPLPCYLRDELGAAVNPDVMVKLLDCNDWLSIQVHPSQEVCDRIGRALNARTRQTAEFEELWNGVRSMKATDGRKNMEEALTDVLVDKEDDLGKDELFYVISQETPASQETPLLRTAPYILGFENSKVRGLAGYLHDRTSRGQWQDLLNRPDAHSGVKDLILKHSRLLSLSFARDLLNEVETAPYREELQREENRSSLKRIYRCYRSEFKECLGNWLAPILRLRPKTSTRELDGIVFILAIEALKNAIDQAMPLSAGNTKLRQCIVGALFRDKQSPLLGYFHHVESLGPGEAHNIGISHRSQGLRGAFVWVKAGVVHAAGSGLYMVEASHTSNNTFRILDHGRELVTNRRDMHYALAAIALSEESFVDSESERRYVFPSPRSPAPVDLIRMQPFGPTELAEPGTVASAFGHGGCVVVCTRGKVHADIKYRADANVERVYHVELPTGHSAYVLPSGAGRSCELKLRTERYCDDSECVVVSTRNVHAPPVLSLSIGESDAGFVYHKPAQPVAR